VCGECVDDIPPNLLLESVETCWRLRAALSWDKGYD
jgi:hypothetical protein